MTKCALASLVAAITFVSMPAGTQAQGLVGGPPPRYDRKGKVVQTKPGEDESGADKFNTEGDRDSVEVKPGGAVSKSPYGAFRKPLSEPFELVPAPPLRNPDAAPQVVPDMPPPRPGRELDDWLFWMYMVFASLVGATFTMVAVLIISRRSKRSASASDTVFVSRRLFYQITLYADMRLLLRLAEMFRGDETFDIDRVDQFRRQMRTAKDAMRTASPDLERVDALLAEAKSTLFAILRSDPKTEPLGRLFK